MSTQIINILEFVSIIKASGVLSVDSLRDRRSVATRKRKWEDIHIETKHLGLVSSKNSSKSREYWNELKKRAEDNLCLLRAKQIKQINDLDRQILITLGITETELLALETASISEVPIIKRERVSNSERIIDVEDDRLKALKVEVLKAKTIACKLKAYKLTRELDLSSDEFNKIRNWNV